MEKRKNVPKLRFKGFDDEWKLEHLFKYLKESRIVGSEGSKAKKLTVKLWGKGIVPKREIYEGSDNTKYFTRQEGQLMYGKLDFLNCAFGIVPKELDGYESTVDAPAFDIKNINSYFLLSKIIQKNFYKRNGDIADGSRKAKRIHSDVFLDMKIKVPSLEEQDKIAGFLSNVDKIIEEQEEKVKDLEQYKKGMMQKIFKREIRFKDENGQEYPEWEKSKLEKYIIEYTDKTTINNQYPVLTSSRKGIILQSDYFKERQITTENNIGYYIIPKGYITFRSRSDDGIFVFNENTILDKGIISYFYPVFKLKENINSYYARIYMNNYLKKDILREIVGTSQLVLSMNKLKRLEINHPCLEEQKKIADILSNMDKVIEEENKKLEDSRLWKKGLLQQMFI
ncbi:restriction endonuclease subunit S [uncultured Clostridium sp.]|uniref:restriction endonuclease subunit S n=1 Tax=uncultured Clostridium sp. TaxID=59620 RepID=UPI00263349C0|nr:restriction endonuclease subunit S [uncultured Clostridium sp.]